MNGNVWEWVQDNEHKNYNGVPSDGSSWNGIIYGKVYRGGGWSGFAKSCRSAACLGDTSKMCNARIGFRLSRDAIQARRNSAGSILLP